MQWITKKLRSYRFSFVLVWFVVLALCVWRLQFILAAPDLDTDAYGHHVIARQILKEPTNLSIHWVWLPLFHYIQALAIGVGASLNSIRILNSIITALSPILLYNILQFNRTRNLKFQNDYTPWLAALLSAFSSVGMQIGTTGQTEPLFAFSILSLLWCIQRSKRIYAAFVLSVAVMLRYEAWAVLCVIPLIGFYDVWKNKQGSLSKWALVVAMPTITILIWAVLRRFVDGGWFLFLKGTTSFANEALGVKSAFNLGLKQVIYDSKYYMWDVAYRCIGLPVFLAPIGIIRTIRREGISFVLIYLALLAFVTYAWLTRSSLGLDRHFVVLVPFYGTLIANGISAIADVVDSYVRQTAFVSKHAFALPKSIKIGIISGLSVAVCWLNFELVYIWMDDWRNKAKNLWPDRYAVITYLRLLPSNAHILCDEPTIEVLSGLDRHRFDRDGLDSKERMLQLVQHAKEENHSFYVVAWSSKLSKSNTRGELVFSTHGSESFTILRLDL